MSWNTNSHGLPFLPGYTFQDITKTSFHRPQTLVYSNGFPLPRPVGIRQDPLLSEQLIQQDINKLTLETQDVTSGSLRMSLPKQFVPAYVALDKKVLRFYAYFQEDVQFSRDEVYRIRPVNIYYYLEDDTICIYEPKVENSGLVQGKRLNRRRVPKNERGEHYKYKDLNLGIDLVVYGFKYHITHCDEFTTKFMESQGIILNDPEPMPVDPYTNRRKIPLPCRSKPSELDSRHRFLTLDGKEIPPYNGFGSIEDSLQNCLFLIPKPPKKDVKKMLENSDKVLCYIARLDTGNPINKDRKFILSYFLSDDTIRIFEKSIPNSGFTGGMFLKRIRVPKPGSTMDNPDFYSPADFAIGATLNVFGHRFVLTDAEQYVLTYLESISNQIPFQTLESVRQKLGAGAANNQPADEVEEPPE